MRERTLTIPELAFIARNSSSFSRLPLDSSITKSMTRFLTAAFVGVSFWALASAPAHSQGKPAISVSAPYAKAGDLVLMTGTGFTPNRTVMSHLRRPDGSDYHPLRLRTNELGEFLHKIDTVTLEIGMFELWVEDETTHVESNRVHFSVE